ncbi:MAG: hypothetical protein HZB40_04480 [Rhodocyclales bacterium]|nr:hypothetical protein [Rhodocyclales bacterium]
MNGKSTGSIWLCTRDGALRSLLRAAITSQGLTPLDIKPEQLLANAAAGIVPEIGSVMLFDLARENLDGEGVSDALRRLAALPWRPRLFAIAPTARTIWRNEIDWCRRRTGLPLLPRPETGVAAFLARLFSEIGLAAPDPRRLDTHLRVLLGDREEAAESLARHLTGDSIDALAASLIAGGNVGERRYHLRKYPECMIGSDAVDWLTRRHGCTRVEAVSLGLALERSGLLHHVVKQQAFRDGEFFYRLAVPGRFDAVALDDAELALRTSTGLIADRAWRGIGFPRCMVGSEAIDALCAAFGLGRAEATLLGQSLMDLGQLRHVADEHPFADDNLFYELRSASFSASPQMRAATA